MFKKVMFFAICIAIGGFAIYKIANNVISDEVDNANFRAVELYANAIKLSTVNINNVMSEDDTVDYNKVNIGTNVKCDSVKVSSIGDVELHGCTVENGKTKYKYTNGKAKKE